MIVVNGKAHSGENTRVWIEQATSERMHLDVSALPLIKEYTRNTSDGQLEVWWWLGWNSRLSPEPHQLMNSEPIERVDSAVVERGTIHVLSLGAASPPVGVTARNGQPTPLQQTDGYNAVSALTPMPLAATAVVVLGMALALRARRRPEPLHGSTLRTHLIEELNAVLVRKSVTGAHALGSTDASLGKHTQGAGPSSSMCISAKVNGRFESAESTARIMERCPAVPV
jgi:hypothetical protein